MGYYLPILQPGDNPEEEKDYTFQDPESRHILETTIEGINISPDSHPRVCDLGSGTGGVPKILVENGWQEEKITCFDHSSPGETNHVPRANWKFLDLKNLALSIEEEIELPEEIFSMKGKINIITVYQCPLKEKFLSILFDFFLAPNGVVIMDGEVRDTHAKAA